MKKSKLLFLTPCVAIAIIAPIITSCEPSSGLTIERIIDDIFYPHEKQDPPAGTNNIMEALQTVSSEEEMQNELIYDLFLENHLFDDEGLKFKELYEQGKIGIKANITKCSLGFKDVSGVKKLYATFLGYVSFVFLQKISEDAQANDYVMITYDMLNLEVNQYAY
ncbi:MAG: hypothetical protein MJ233_01855 [Mycoplasmoidaceae bacterium]|nr:hypothetical protein [Mycoplasmoidaceae bacterium]